MPEEIMNEEVVETATEAIADAGFGLKEAGIVGGAIAGAAILVFGGIKLGKKVTPKIKEAFNKAKQDRKDKKNGKYVEAEILEK